MTTPGVPGNVLFVTPGFAVGGAESFLVSLLNSFDRDRFGPVVVSLSDRRELEKALNLSIEVTRIPRRWKYDITPAARLAAVIAAHDITSVFSLGLYPFFFVRLAMVLAKRRPRVFVSIHLTQVRSRYEHVQWLLYTTLLRKEDVLLGVCHNQAQTLSRKYRIPPDRFRVIYNGVDLDRWTLQPDGFDRQGVRAGFGILGAADVIVQVAAFRTEKRHEVSLAALAIVHKESRFTPHLLFVGAGGGEAEETLRRCSIEYGISSHVTFCGERSDVRPFYWMSDLFTLSSNNETFSIAALEAMATGLPCVLTDVGGTREMVIEGTNGYLVPPENPRLLAETWLQVLRRKADFSPESIRATVASRFSLERCVRSYEQLLYNA